ncbi:hypothetical protein DID76_01900 [Candidatus Marinamargulisbacteria bacterium SCGC AG-414-C22]|nr:hypothetical protein DID76_01900 [Candidatus Marinamargulisbacteria bacterium SCGC AG-414-C22]
MITSLCIRNFITIEHSEINFSEGLTVVTGESGAGKSIIFNAIELLFGKSANAAQVGTFLSYFSLEGCFTIDHLPDDHPLHDFHDGDHHIIIYRKIDQVKQNLIKINHRTVNLKMLKELTQDLAIIVSQHQQLALTKPQYQRNILDRYQQLDQSPLMSTYSEAYSDYVKACDERKQLALDEQYQQQLEFLAFQIKDIEQYDFQPDEDTQLEDKKRYIKQHNKHNKTVHSLAHEVSSLSTAISNCQSTLADLTDISHFKEHEDSLNQCYTLIDQLSLTTATYQQQTEHFSDADIDHMEDRLDIMFKMKTKYNVQHINQLIELKNDLLARQHKLDNVAATKAALEKSISQKLERVIKLGKDLHINRQEAASLLETAINQQLTKLHFPADCFSIDLLFDESKPMAYGCTHVEFLAQLNPGVPKKPIHKCASGGELSRLLLAFYCAASENQSQQLFLFDEIDTGLGGLTANAVGKTLETLSNGNQILCITHLAQIAQCAHHHVLVSKRIQENCATSSFKHLDETTKMAELQRMVGGKKMTAVLSQS